MIQKIREQQIIDHLQKNKSATIKELAVLLHSSESSIRRDKKRTKEARKRGRLRKAPPLNTTVRLPGSRPEFRLHHWCLPPRRRGLTASRPRGM